MFWKRFKILVLFLLIGFGINQCSKNPQLPSIHYKPELVVFGILSPGSYEFKGKTLDGSLGRNFFVVQRTYQMDEKLVLQNFDSVSIFIDSVKLFPVGYVKREFYIQDSNYQSASDSTRVYSFDQKKFAIKPNMNYALRVNVPNYGSLRANTLVPDSPAILLPEDTVSYSQKSITVKWTPVESVGGYRVCILVKDKRSNEEWPLIENEVSPETQQYVVNLEPLWDLNHLETISVEVQALDENYANYLSLRNLFFSNCLTKDNFNVKGGYGLFGSMASTKKTLIFKTE